MMDIELYFLGIFNREHAVEFCLEWLFAAQVLLFIFNHYSLRDILNGEWIHNFGMKTIEFWECSMFLGAFSQGIQT